jgi:hypothetical protein
MENIIRKMASVSRISDSTPIPHVVRPLEQIRGKITAIRDERVILGRTQAELCGVLLPLRQGAEEELRKGKSLG